jgi:hypothetical protein
MPKMAATSLSRRSRRYRSPSTACHRIGITPGWFENDFAGTIISLPGKNSFPSHGIDAARMKGSNHVRS